MSLCHPLSRAFLNEEKKKMYILFIHKKISKQSKIFLKNSNCHVCIVLKHSQCVGLQSTDLSRFCQKHGQIVQYDSGKKMVEYGAVL